MDALFSYDHHLDEYIYYVREAGLLQLFVS